MICGLCGDPLMKKKMVNLKRIFGLVAAFALISPLIITIVLLFKDFSNEKLPKNSDLLVEINLFND